MEVDDLKVSLVTDESDGDWHLNVTDGKVLVFITEVTPYWQVHGVERPAVGLIINEVGYPYCDTVHSTEAWHGYTCWEIHPVIKWNLHNGSPQSLWQVPGFKSRRAR